MIDNIKDPHINYDADHLANALRYMLYSKYYICVCLKCGFKDYTEIKQCNCPQCGCDGEHFRCTKL